MPLARLKPADIAGEAKRTYIPYIDKQMPQYVARSFLYADATRIRVDAEKGTERTLVAVVNGDPLDVALDWHEFNLISAARRYPDVHPADVCTRMPVVNMANEKRAGGDWESGTMAPEECLCRRTNLVQTLTNPMDLSTTTPHYPLPQMGGLYSPSVVVYRSGPDRYQVMSEFKVLPVISVAPVRRPKLDETGKQYSFGQEKELMLEKMRTILRIAAAHNHKDLVVGAFGVGNTFRNPVDEVAHMWRYLLYGEDEFANVFANVTFAIESNPSGQSGDGAKALQVFSEVFDPEAVHQYR